MQRVYTSDNLMLAGLVKSHLEENDIPCLLKNESLAGGIGELPPIECWPEVWICDDNDMIRAERIINKMQSEFNVQTEDWQCACGEKIEGQFSACWNCGKEKTGN